MFVKRLQKKAALFLALSLFCLWCGAAFAEATLEFSTGPEGSNLGAVTWDDDRESYSGRVYIVGGEYDAPHMPSMDITFNVSGSGWTYEPAGAEVVDHVDFSLHGIYNERIRSGVSVDVVDGEFSNHTVAVDKGWTWGTTGISLIATAKDAGGNDVWVDNPDGGQTQLMENHTLGQEFVFYQLEDAAFTYVIGRSQEEVYQVELECSDDDEVDQSVILSFELHRIDSQNQSAPRVLLRDGSEAWPGSGITVRIDQAGRAVSFVTEPGGPKTANRYELPDGSMDLRYRFLVEAKVDDFEIPDDNGARPVKRADSIVTGVIELNVLDYEIALPGLPLTEERALIMPVGEAVLLSTEIDLGAPELTSKDISYLRVASDTINATVGSADSGLSSKDSFLWNGISFDLDLDALTLEICGTPLSGDQVDFSVDAVFNDKKVSGTEFAVEVKDDQIRTSNITINGEPYDESNFYVGQASNIVIRTDEPVTLTAVAFVDPDGYAYLMDEGTDYVAGAVEREIRGDISGSVFTILDFTPAKAGDYKFAFEYDTARSEEYEQIVTLVAKEVKGDDSGSSGCGAGTGLLPLGTTLCALAALRLRRKG